MTTVVLITGPKRSGKTQLALALQKLLPGETKIVNDAQLRSFVGSAQGSVDEYLDMTDICDILTNKRFQYVLLEWECGNNEFLEWLSADKVFVTAVGIKELPKDWPEPEFYDRWFVMPLEYYDADSVVADIVSVP